MRYILLLLTVYFSSISCFSQNILFFHFGEKHEKVIENLNKFPVDSIEIETKLKPLTAFYDGFIARYHFNAAGKLYKIEVSKNYEVKRNAKDAVNGALDYFEEIHASMDNTNIKGTKVYRAKSKEHYYEMQEVNYADNDIDLFLVGWSADLSPEAWIGNDVVSEEDLIEVHEARTAQRELELAKAQQIEEEKLRLAAEQEALVLKQLELKKDSLPASATARLSKPEEKDLLVAKSIQPVEEEKTDTEVKAEAEEVEPESESEE